LGFGCGHKIEVMTVQKQSGGDNELRFATIEARLTKHPPVSHRSELFVD
jgi:hypothetical protein